MSNTGPNVNEFLISVSAMQDVKRKDFKTFLTWRANELNLPRIITSRVWSPIVYSGSRRSKDNFESSQIIALDCDNGAIKLADLISTLREWDCWCVVGTTKSHQREKKSDSGEIKPPCDRFRVFFKMSAPTIDREHYEYNFAQWVQKFQADKGVKDAARYFYPCVEIAFAHFGAPIDFMPLPISYVREADRQKVARHEIQRFRDEGTIPPWVLRCVNDGPKDGRHNASYAVGAALTELGYSLDEIVEYIMTGPISAIGEADVRRAVENARNKIVGAQAGEPSCGGGENARRGEEQGASV